MDKTVAAMALHFQKYFAYMAECAGKYPPWPNAAHGSFVRDAQKAGAMFGTSYKDHEQFKITTAAGLNLSYVYTDFNRFMMFAFSNDLYEASMMDRVKLNKDVILKSIETIVTLIGTMTGDNSEQGRQRREEQKRKLAKDVDELMNKMQNDNAHQGNHANGHIASGVKAAAGGAKLNFQILDMWKKEDPAYPVVLVVDAICDRLYDFDTDPAGHKPWLRGTWQTQFGAICLAGAVALEQFNPSKPQAAN